MTSRVVDYTQTRLKAVPPYLMLDAWRGLAALWVVMVHSCITVIGAGGDSPELAKQPIYAFSLWGQLGVSLFFVISGYCIANAAVSALRKPKPLLHFIRSRIRRIYPPYFFSIFVGLLSAMGVAFLVSHGKLPAPHHHTENFFGHGAVFYLATLTLTQPVFHAPLVNVVVWSLCYEIVFYVIVAILIAMTYRSLNPVPLLTGMHVITLFSLGWLIISPATCPFPLDRWPQFGLGALVYNLVAQPDGRKEKMFFGVAVILALVQAIHYSGPHYMGHPSSRIQILTCVMFIFLLLALHPFDKALMKNPVVHILGWLGTFSYSLY